MKISLVGERELDQHARDQRLLRAWLIGLLSTKTYAWLWISLWKYGRNWRWN